MKDTIKRFEMKIGKDINSLYFLFGNIGRRINIKRKYN